MNTTTTGPPDLLSNVPKGIVDLQRDGGGYHVQLIFLPDLKKPEEAHITLFFGAEIESFTVPFDNYKDVYFHPCGYSAKLRDYLAPPKGKAAAN